MSWSCNYIGEKEAIIRKLNEDSEKYMGQSKEEFDAALPHLVALINMNICRDYNPLIQIEANGHANKTTIDDVEKINYSNCKVNIQQLGGMILVK